MHPSQVGPFRKFIIAAILVAFAGGLMLFTANANIALLQGMYPDPQFIGFGILSLEGGIVVWTALYILFTSGFHKGTAVVALGVDMILSCTGFYYEISNYTHSATAAGLPTVVDVIAFSVIFNVFMGLLAKLVPTHAVVPTMPRQEQAYTPYQQGYAEPAQQSYSQTGSIDNNSSGIGEKIKDVAAGAVALVQDVNEMAQAKRTVGRPRKNVQSIDSQEEIEVAKN